MKNQPLIATAEIYLTLTPYLDLSGQKQGQVLILFYDIFHVVESKSGRLLVCLVAEAVYKVLVGIVHPYAVLVFKGDYLLSLKIYLVKMHVVI